MKLSPAQRRVLEELIKHDRGYVNYASHYNFKTHTLRWLRDQGLIIFWANEGVAKSYSVKLTDAGRELVA